MRKFCVLFLLNWIGLTFPLVKEFDEKWYDYYLKEFKDILRNGSSAMGIPRMDPLKINSTFVWDDHSNKVRLHLEGLLSNFSDFYVNTIEIKPDLQSMIEIQFTAVNFVGNYQLNGKAFTIFPLEGNGNFKVFVGNTVLLAEGKVLGSNRTIQISNFKFNYDIGVSKVVIFGLLEEYHLSNIIQNFLSDVVPTGLNKLKNQVQKIIDQVTSDLGNKLLRKMDPKHIIEIVKMLLLPNNKEQFKK